MTKTCPSCDILAPPDARYCRHCGTQLKRVGAASGENVSPIAATMPLSGQNTTDEIVAPHASPSSANAQTSEVTHEELDDLLQHRSGGDNTRSGEVRHAEAERANDGGRTHARADGRDEGRDGLSNANYAETYRADAAPDFSPDDFDPEQTQITINVRPLTSRNLPADAAAAASVATTHASSKPQFNSAPQQVTLSPTGSLQTADTTTNVSPSSPTSPRLAAAPRSTESRALRVWLGMGAAILSIVVIVGVAFAAFWYGTRGWRNSPTPPAPVSETAPAAPDPKELVQAKLNEADAAIAIGHTEEAEASLRDAAALDLLNPEPQRRLARLLLARGARREGIEALRVVTRLVPTDAEAWRTLATAQSAEGLYADAVESYRGLGEASPAALARDSVQLAYADALRLSGRMSEARVIYRRLAASSDAEVAAASRQQLGLPPPTPADEETEDADAHTAETAARETAAARAEETARTTDGSSALPATPDPSATRNAPPTTGATTTTTAPAKASPGSPSEQYQRGVGLWGTNRAAALAELRAAAERGNSDASYYLGLSIAEGRDPRALKRAELVAAIVYFGRARRGKFRAQAVTYEEHLGRELDRRRGQ
jgi:tetratricopeptide (TPR) repeat protein